MSHSSTSQPVATNGGGSPVRVSLEAHPERRLIRPSGSNRHVHFQISVTAEASAPARDRMPVTLALVLDRSGSMSGEKLATAKTAALSVIDLLEQRDHVAVTTFDDRIETLQERSPVTAALRRKMRADLKRLEARASTALHEGWLTGCRSIADDTASGKQPGVARCFLLTDGLANVGVTDPEAIATEAAGIRAHTGISTSTFGIGTDYDERLLGPMAVAGGGQFHNLRTPAEIANTFLGELGELLAIAARQVTLEIESDAAVTADLVSQYWREPSTEGSRWKIAIGDLLGGDERHVVVRFGFPPRAALAGLAVRARLVWMNDNDTQTTDWQEVPFTYADDRACDDEPRDARVMHWVGLQHAERAKIEATRRNLEGDLAGARRAVSAVARRIATYASGDDELLAAQQDLEETGEQLASAPMSAAMAKETYSVSQRKSRCPRDFR